MRMDELPAFDEAFRARLRELFIWRRDVRRFRTDPLPEGCIERLVETACLSPSVGLSQPWRFVLVTGAARRQAVIADFKTCNVEALGTYSGELAQRYAALKLAGLEEAPCQLAVFCDNATDIGHGLGRMTMPDMLDYSVVGAIAMMWLAARAEGIGMGWVSILNPQRIAEILDVPPAWRLIGYFCLGYPSGESDRPELEAAKWERRLDPQSLILRR
jgi:5,6-dimethylbenzimidazole synthase